MKGRLSRLITDEFVGDIPGIKRVQDEEYLDFDTREPIGRVLTFTLGTPTRPDLRVAFKYNATEEPRIIWDVTTGYSRYTPTGRSHNVLLDPLGQHKDEDESEQQQ